ncbi:hypothetical protein ACO0RG_004364 [Hanseniaspora osmophila]
MLLLPAQITKSQLEKFKNEYKERRRVQMLRFFGASIFTLITARLAHRSIQSRKYVPKMFENNYKVPPFSYQYESISALLYGSAFSIGGFGMFVTGACWMNNISTFPEFSKTLKLALLGEEGVEELNKQMNALNSQPLDEDTKGVLEVIENAWSNNNKKE